MWTEADKVNLVRQAKELEATLGRALRPQDLRRVRIRGRSFLAIKSQAARLGLYEPTRKTCRWSSREEQILRLLTRERGLGARGIKGRGFFCNGSGQTVTLNERSIDSIAQKMRRSGLVDPERSRRARYAKRLTRDEKRRLRKELRENPHDWTTEQFGYAYEVAPSTIRRYRKKWRIRHTWSDAMALPPSIERRRQLAEETRERNIAAWEKRKQKLLDRLEATKKRFLSRAKNRANPPELRTCVACGREWPETEKFFAPSPKRREGKVVAVYLRRTCRVCPRRTHNGNGNGMYDDE